MIGKISWIRQVVLALWLVAAGAASAWADPQGEVPGGRNVRVLLSQHPVTLDPWDAQDNTSLGIAQSVYEGLYRLDRQMQIRPVLAEDCEVSHDGRTYTIRLRQGVRFHDGTVCDATAVKRNFDRVLDPRNRLRRHALYAIIDEVAVLDERTVRFTLTAPYSSFLHRLAHPSAGIISPRGLETLGGNIRFAPVGTGPFVLDEWRRGEFVRVRRNPSYWRAGLPKVDTLTWISVPVSDSRMAMMALGEGHLAVNIRSEQAEFVRATPGLEMRQAESIQGDFVTLNVRQKPFDDVRVRQALNYAVDREALLHEVYKGYATVTEGVIPAGVEFAARLGRWPYDPQKARALLAEAGYASGFETELWSTMSDTRSRQLVRLLQKQLARVGVKVDIRVLENAERLALVESNVSPETAPVRMLLVQWAASTGEADWALRPLLHGAHAPPTAYNTAYYNNPEVNALLEAALLSGDGAEKAKLYRQAQERIWNDAPWIFLFTLQTLYVVNNRLKNMYLMPDGTWFFEDMELLP